MYTKKESAEAIEKLRATLKPGDTVSTVLRHVSRSGMQREISLFIGECERIDWLVARALSDRIGKHDGIVATGCGMDMGFSLVYNLGRTLWPDGVPCSGKGCQSNDHSNGDRDYTPHANHPQVCKDNPETCTGAKHWHGDGGYAFRHQWI
jgi:hypothetical protein